MMGIAAERIDRLTALARAAAKEGDDDRAREYVRLARRIAERHRIELPESLTRFSCDRCDRFLVPGRNARVRTRDGHVVVTCECGAHSRYPYEG
ncbi:MAG: ribonuclease P protein component 4 [Halanaeroarchaeum sp.]